MSAKALLCCAVSGLFCFTAQARAATGKLTVVAGQVWVKPAGGSEQTAAEGQSVSAGTQIRTGENGRAAVAFEDGSELRLEPGSQLVLSPHKRNKAEKNSVVLFFGRLWSKVTGSSGGGRNYEVKTPNAVCGVRGTEFVTAVGDDGSARVRVSEGTVGVAGDEGSADVSQGEEVEADEEGVGDAGQAEERAKWKMWEKRKKERLRTQGRKIVDKMKGKIMTRKGKLEALREEQKQLEQKRKKAESRARRGDRDALNEIKAINSQLAEIADAIADIGDEADSQFGIVDHYADLASDPRFKMIDRKYLKAEAASLRRIKKMFDDMVKEGTDISIEAMDNMLKDMRDGKTGSLKDNNSAADDLFGGGGGDMDMDMDMH